MGSPLEYVEFGPFKCIISNTACYFRYIDDILLIYPQSITDRLNNVKPSIKFTYEIESKKHSTFPGYLTY